MPRPVTSDETVLSYTLTAKAGGIMTNNLQEQSLQLASIIKGSKRLVALTGAGISVPSGIPDFRSATGLYRMENGGAFSAEFMLSHTCFSRYPEEFFRFYRQKMLYPDAKPNIAHRWLARLEEGGILSAIVTQNIDGLHTAAGSRNVIEFHGSVHRNYCTECGARYGLDFILTTDGIARCPQCGGIVRPDVVLYEESLDDDVVRRSVDAVASADTLLVIGTSLIVYPAAGLIEYFGGRNLVLINKGETAFDRKARLVINADVASVAEILSEQSK